MSNYEITWNSNQIDYETWLKPLKFDQTQCNIEFLSITLLEAFQHCIANGFKYKYDSIYQIYDTRVQLTWCTWGEKKKFVLVWGKNTITSTW